MYVNSGFPVWLRNDAQIKVMGRQCNIHIHVLREKLLSLPQQDMQGVNSKARQLRRREITQTAKFGGRPCMNEPDPEALADGNRHGMGLEEIKPCEAQSSWYTMS